MNKIYPLQRMNYNLPAKALFFISPLFFGHLAKGMEQAVEVPAVREFPLHEAARAGDLACIKRLAQKREMLEMPDQHGNTPLHCAAQAGKIESIDCLIER